MLPIVVISNEHHIAMGQRKWNVQGGFPHVCHGGLPTGGACALHRIRAVIKWKGGRLC
ncbi:MAG TPA: hypothetical protein VFG29_04465 [Syntrophales bacterium]|nr:hypothetical protein [Syntrophales bacterium]